MRVSTDRVEAALKTAEAAEQLIARRILESATSWDQWERAHSDLMRRVASCNARAQVEELKQTTFRLLHGKALFQYLRRAEVRGEERMRLIAHFRPGRSFEAAMISEHGDVSAQGVELSLHESSRRGRGAAIRLSSTRCSATRSCTASTSICIAGPCSAPPKRPNRSAPCLPLLKHQLGVHRAAILDPRGAQTFLRREAELRRPTGDTQRLLSLGRPKRKLTALTPRVRGPTGSRACAPSRTAASTDRSRSR